MMATSTLSFGRYRTLDVLFHYTECSISLSGCDPPLLCKIIMYCTQLCKRVTIRIITKIVILATLDKLKLVDHNFPAAKDYTYIY